MTGHLLCDVDAHKGRRIWGLAHSTHPPFLCASASDEGTARLWAGREMAPAGVVRPPAGRSGAAVPVCGLDFSPSHEHLLALACADHKVHVFDLRHTGSPLVSLSHHRKPVSYVKFLDGGRLVSAATDGSLALWPLPLHGYGSSSLDTPLASSPGHAAAAAAAAAVSVPAWQHAHGFGHASASAAAGVVGWGAPVGASTSAQAGQEVSPRAAAVAAAAAAARRQRRRQEDGGEEEEEGEAGEVCHTSTCCGGSSTMCSLAQAVSTQVSLGGTPRSGSPVGTKDGAGAGAGASTGPGAQQQQQQLQPSHVAPTKVMRGHKNERNFVGLAVQPEEGLIACGSETPHVFTYHTSWTSPLASLDVVGVRQQQQARLQPGVLNPQVHALQAWQRPGSVAPFVSSVCWQPSRARQVLGLPSLLAAGSSQGAVDLLMLAELEE